MFKSNIYSLDILNRSEIEFNAVDVAFKIANFYISLFDEVLGNFAAVLRALG